MCGIGGVWGEADVTSPATLARRLGDGLAHRGPDGEAFLAIHHDSRAELRRTREAFSNDDRLAGLFVHRRLSIIDLVTGDQPMAVDEGRCWIVYNGEVYNHRELRAELAAGGGEPFRTHSDTEVILQVYRRWGIHGFARLNGIFAFAIYDARQRHLVLARDPVGIKPLYWTRGTHGVAFASEIRPLLDSGFAQRAVAPAAVAQFLFYRFVAAPDTVWRDVHKVRPGHALRFAAGGVLVQETDFAPAAPAPSSNHRDLSDMLAPQLDAAVGRQLLSDVPVGAFLSGGVDSSIVVSAAARRVPEFPTFAVGFVSGPDRGELDLAGRAARHLGTRHTESPATVEDYWSRWPWAVAQVEEPLAHPGMLLQADLAALARSQVKVVLTGQGADEPLGGYPRHYAARLVPLLAGVLGGVARSSRWNGVAWGGERLARIRCVLAARAGVERAAALFSPLTPEDAGEMARGVGRDAGREAVLGALRPWWARADGLDDVARTLYVDVRTSLAEDLLLVADKMAMAHALEARVPFLDLDYLRVIEAIPGPERVGLLAGRKRIQFGMARRLLPPALARELGGTGAPWRRKRGFDVPVDQWFRGLGPRLTAFLLGPRSFLPEHVDAERAHRALEGFMRGSRAGYRQVLALFVLETWLRVFVGQLESAGAAPASSS